MRDYEVNPFQELYVTDSAEPTVFVQLFSDEPVKSAHQLFRPGNVVLKGTQGSGKSTLLSLFRPEIRLAYHKAAATFPVPHGLDRFIAGGINLRKSGALDIGQRPIGPTGGGDDEATFPFVFADFLNYFIVRDLLESIQVVSQSPQAFDSLVDRSQLDEFARLLASQDCWFGALSPETSFDGVVQALDRRITAYRQFHVFTIARLPGDLDHTRTNIGEPISRTAECMRLSGLVASNTPVFVRIDELDRVVSSDKLRPQLGRAYRQLINKAIGMRDARVSYRIGTRRYGWESDLAIFGTTDKLEDLRDFRIIDLDANMRRAENPQDWVFPSFAADALRRRVSHSGFNVDPRADVLRTFFSTTPPAELAATDYVAKPGPERVRILRCDDMPRPWRTFLTQLVADDPLEAVLAAAWAHQAGDSASGSRMEVGPPPNPPPWKKMYWKKERVRQALMQIAARAPHRLKWSGKDQILALSGANITVFLSLCHEIWDALHRARRAREAAGKQLPSDVSIDRNIQSVGIHAASELWHKKITEQPGGNDRQRFINVIGSKFRDWLINDVAMSYPGRNGFSLAIADLARNPALTEFLNDAVAYGDLYAVQHTTKEKNRRARRKWYLNPILSPYFQIPETHTKEPYYAEADEVVGWLAEADVILTGEGTVPSAAPTHRATTGRKRAGRRTVRQAPDLFADGSDGS